ncbi:hypothetical protein ElyMa_000703900 [Elysia marginata]|uniref:Uncharacterized protein n=1 Tax=Elysia marginata TaxID=1093978 RepID=A0AAV4GJ47_9GAST|nr:hypothetical protein ElyMa_000703900 [Elysia marginata]
MTYYNFVLSPAVLQSPDKARTFFLKSPVWNIRDQSLPVPPDLDLCSVIPWEGLVTIDCFDSFRIFSKFYQCFTTTSLEKETACSSRFMTHCSKCGASKLHYATRFTTIRGVARCSRR